MRCGWRSKGTIYKTEMFLGMWASKLGGDGDWDFLCQRAGHARARKRHSHLLDLQGGEMLYGMCGALCYFSKVVF